MQHITQAFFSRGGRRWCLLAASSLAMGLSACGGGGGSPAEALLTQASLKSVDVLEADLLPGPWVVDPQAPLLVPKVTLLTTVPTQAPPPQGAPTANTGLNSAVSAVGSWVQALGFFAMPSPIPEGTSRLFSASSMALPVADPGVLMLLLPDALDLNDPGVSAWSDAALRGS